MILFTNYDLFIMNLYDRNGRKTPKYVQTKRKEKSPIWLPSHPRVYENGGRLFSGVQKHRKQAGPTLGGTGILL